MARRALDRYLTPVWATEALLRHFPEVRGELLLDPTSGDGRMADQLLRAGRFSRCRLNDLGEPHAPVRAPETHLDGADPALYEPRPCWVVSNPPFNASGDIVYPAVQGAARGVAMLLRATFGEPCGPCPRAPRAGRQWLLRHPPRALLLLPRISFTGDGETDSAAAWWFLWGDAVEPRIVVADKAESAGQELLAEVGDLVVRGGLRVPERRFTPQAELLLPGIDPTGPCCRRQQTTKQAHAHRRSRNGRKEGYGHARCEAGKQNRRGGGAEPRKEASAKAHRPTGDRDQECRTERFDAHRAVGMGRGGRTWTLGVHRVARPQRHGSLVPSEKQGLVFLLKKVLAQLSLISKLTPWPRLLRRAGHGAARGGPWEGCALSITVGDLVEYREGFNAPCWRRGYVREMAQHIYKIEALSSGRVVTIKVGGKGRKGTVRELTGRDLVEAVEASRLLPALPSAVGVTLRVLQGGASVAVPRPRSRFRSPAYLAEVRARPCCNCAAAGPSDPHHAGPHGVGQKADDYTAVPLCRRCHCVVTDTYAVPGRSREETELLFLRVQVALVSEWAAGLAEMVADHVEVPVLARCAS